MSDLSDLSDLRVKVEVLEEKFRSLKNQLGLYAAVATLALVAVGWGSLSTIPGQLRDELNARYPDIAGIAESARANKDSIQQFLGEAKFTTRGVRRGPRGFSTRHRGHAPD